MIRTEDDFKATLENIFDTFGIYRNISIAHPEGDYREAIKVIRNGLDRLMEFENFKLSMDLSIEGVHE